MSALANARYERFVRSIVQGMSASRAYVGSGFSARGGAAEAGASRLLKRPEVAARLRELSAEITETVMGDTAFSREWVVQRLMAMADGVPYGDDPAGEAVPMKVRLQALHDLAQHAGLFTPVADTETAARGLARQMQIPLDEARLRIAEAERFIQEHR